LKIQYIVDDLANVLTEYYMKLRNINVNDTKRTIMKLHMKQAISDTYKYLYEPVEEVWMIDVLYHMNLHTYELNHDVDYDRIEIDTIIQDIREKLDIILNELGDTINNSDDIIIIRCVPFDGFSISTRDITQLLDLDCDVIRK